MQFASSFQVKKSVCGHESTEQELNSLIVCAEEHTFSSSVKAVVES